MYPPPPRVSCSLAASSGGRRWTWPTYWCYAQTALYSWHRCGAGQRRGRGGIRVCYSSCLVQQQLAASAHLPEAAAAPDCKVVAAPLANQYPHCFLQMRTNCKLQEQQDVDDLTEATELLNLATALLKAANELVPDSVNALRRRAQTVGRGGGWRARCDCGAAGAASGASALAASEMLAAVSASCTLRLLV